MAMRWRWLVGVESWKQGSWLLGRACSRGCCGADDGDAEVAGLTRRRECLAVVGVCEVVAGVADADVALVLERKGGGYQEMRANVVNAKEQTEGRGRAYSRQSWRIMAASARSPVRDSGGLGAWDGVGFVGIERGGHRPFIGAEKEGDRTIMARIGDRRNCSAVMARA